MSEVTEQKSQREIQTRKAVSTNPTTPSPFCEGPGRRIAARRYPIFPVLIALIAGVLVDRFSSISWVAWMIVGMTSLMCWIFFFYKSQIKTAILFLLLACAAVGGIRHHYRWYLLPEDSITHYLSEERKLASLKATVLSAPEFYEVKKPWSSQPVFYTRCVLRCEELDLDSGKENVTGKIRLVIKEKATNLKIGDIIHIVGWISKPARPQNPGDFDYREYLKRDGIVAILSIEKSAGIEKIGSSHEWFLHVRKAIEFFRQKCFEQIDSSFDTESAAIARAVLLGDRSLLDDHFVNEFAETGLIHILAISGLHVGIFLAPFWLVFHLMKLSPKSTFFFMVTVILFFILLTGARPSVLRASLVVTLFLGGTIAHRRSSLMNAISLSAIAILLGNPSSLFDVGTQLSFLSVFGILVAGRWGNLFEEKEPLSKIEEIIEEHQSDGIRLVKKICKRPLQALLVSFGIWVTILPLLVHTFHLVSTAGLLVNVLFIPLVGIFLWCGYSFLMCGFLAPFVASLFSSLFLLGIVLLKSFVHFIDTWEYGHFYFSGPPVWWMVSHYILLILSCFIPYKTVHKTLFVSLIVVWLGIGAALGFREHQPSHLECTFLSVGHGVAILIELPDGKVLLYDAGSLTSSKYASRVVMNALWSKGHSKIDAVFISHADADHFNALPEILGKIPIGRVYLTTQFIDHKQPNAIGLYESFQNLSIPVQFVAKGQEITFGEVRMKILHPQSTLRYDNDNANSMVVSVEYQGRRILLTGDLEKEGMDELLKEPTFDVDAMLSPHHGSRKSNPVEFAKWATPEVVVISGSRRANIAAVKNKYDKKTQIFLTAETGAIAIRIYPNGHLETKPFRE